MKENPLIRMDPRSLKGQYLDAALNVPGRIIQISPNHSINSTAKGFSEAKTAALLNYKHAKCAKKLEIVATPQKKVILPIYYAQTPFSED